MREWRSDYPKDTKVDFLEVRGESDLWVAELTIRPA